MTDDVPMADDMLREIADWLEYMQNESEAERLDLVELSEIERVHAITKEKE